MQEIYLPKQKTTMINDIKESNESEENINDAIKSIERFESKLSESQRKHLKFKMILTTHGASYSTRGISVVPITMLKN